MTLNSNYVLGNELAEKMNMHIANISMVHKKLEEDGINDIIKLGNCTFVDKNSKNIPKNFREGIKCNTFTDLTNCAPLSYICAEFNVTKNTIQKLINSKPGNFYIKSIKVISGKKFVEFSDAFVNMTKDCVLYPLNEKETFECMANGDIDGYLKLDKNKYITWYKIGMTLHKNQTSF